MVQVVWAAEAIDDLGGIAAYIAQFNPLAAQGLALRLVAAGESLAEFPERGRAGRLGRRELPTVQPYVIHYRFDGTRVTIDTVRHGRRRPL
jgi:plasmid stabilization system protein ParE